MFFEANQLIMRRRGVVAGAVVLSTIVFMLGLWRTSSTRWTTPPHIATDAIGSPWIEKGGKAEDKAVIIAKMKNENVDWATNDLPDWQHAIYHMDEPDYVLHVPENKGREAQAYLTFLIDHYDNLPEIMVFLHPHLQGWPAAWHTDAAGYNNVNSVNGLKLDYVRQNGYANMRCIADPGCPAEIQPFRNDPTRSAEIAFKEAWSYFFNNSTNVPEQVGTPCCSQFAVSRDQVRKRPQSDYLKYRRWLLETNLTSDVSGRVMEYMWHIMFGKDPIWCPALHTCWCEQFGRC